MFVVVTPAVVPPLIVLPDIAIPGFDTAAWLPPRPATVTTPVPVDCTVVPLRLTPVNAPAVGVACWFALNVISPFMVVRLEPLLRAILLLAASVAWPDPERMRLVPGPILI